jgi:transcription-repair coupling factor (superfamily II helicase)
MIRSVLQKTKVIQNFLNNQSKINRLLAINESLFSILATAINERKNRPVIIVASNLEMAEIIRDDIDFLSTEKLAFFPNDELLPFDEREINPSVLSLRLEALTKLRNIENPILVTDARAICKKMTDPKRFYEKHHILKKGDELDFTKFIGELSEYGFERHDTVESVGSYAVRGGIIDIYPWTNDEPIRIEFYGDEIESIREFDLINQRSIREVESIDIVASDNSESGRSSIFDYLDNAELLIYDLDLVVKKMIQLEEEGLDYVATHNLDQNEFYNHYFKTEEIRSKFESYQLSYSGLEQLNSSNNYKFSGIEQHKFENQVQSLVTVLKKNRLDEIRTIILCDNEGQKERLIEILDDLEVTIPDVQIGSLNHSIHFIDDKLDIINENQIFNRFKRRKAYRKFKRAEAIRALTTLSYGDYVVHIDYGIGKFVGLHTIEFNGAEKECLKLEYDNGDSLYVGIDRINRIQKYVSEEGAHPKLTKLGGKEWDRLKQKTKKQVETIAKDLVDLYAERSLSKGFSFASDTKWQREMEASFPYDDTVDQYQATLDVKRDMENIIPMDRLVCGDVGFGKTEIAIRAAFKAAMDSKQVAVLVPTTILAQQHYETFKERLSNFPVRIDLLSRFRTAKEQKTTAENITNGNVDIVIGTHRMTSDDIKFKDLGLLIIDEEQRFGVKHKEKLKTLRKHVDVLTLSATPIPRTLHQSLVGIRGISNIETAPVNRLPIITEIMPWDDDKIHTAISRELDRDGQIFFVHNRVQSIDQLKGMIETIAPKARCVIAHGQMKERELEKVMIDFKAHKFDILISTMIIENGLDISNANTILINHAERFGLAQLYQLRGRVGRTNRQAFCYLIAPNLNRMTSIAIKRLHAIEEFSELGSGIKISMRDLELRGAGSLLGHQQSGQIESVGYEMYLQILEEAVQEMKAELDGKVKELKKNAVETQFEVDITALFPEDYIENPHERMNLYLRLSKTIKENEIDEIIKEIEDRFGKCPEESNVLFEMFKLRNLAASFAAEKITINKLKMRMYLSEEIAEDASRMQDLLAKFMQQQMASVSFSDKKGFSIHVELKGNEKSIDKITFANRFLQEMLK